MGGGDAGGTDTCVGWWLGFGGRKDSRQVRSMGLRLAIDVGWALRRGKMYRNMVHAIREVAGSKQPVTGVPVPKLLSGVLLAAGVLPRAAERGARPAREPAVHATYRCPSCAGTHQDTQRVRVRPPRRAASGRPVGRGLRRRRGAPGPAAARCRVVRVRVNE